MIEFDGIENYTFEILKEVSKPELCYWEDYFILKFKTFYPEGYNRKWNCNEEIRKEILEEIEKEENKEKQIEERRKEIVEKKYNDNDLWVEFFFDYKLFSFYCFLLKNSIDYNGERIVCNPYCRNEKLVYSIIKKNINLSLETIKKYTKILQDIDLLEGVNIHEIKTITDSFNLENFNSENLLANMILWYIRKENQIKRRVYFYKSDFCLLLNKQSNQINRRCIDSNKKIFSCLELLKKQGLISIREGVGKQYELEIIVL